MQEVNYCLCFLNFDVMEVLFLVLVFVFVVCLKEGIEGALVGFIYKGNAVGSTFKTWKKKRKKEKKYNFQIWI